VSGSPAKGAGLLYRQIVHSIKLQAAKVAKILAA